MAFQGLVRYTQDIDIFFDRSPANARRIVEAIRQFGYESSEFTASGLTKAGMVHYFGRPPNRVDFLNTISGIDFNEAWRKKVSVEIDGLHFHVLSLESLIKNKGASPRPKDQIDADLLVKFHKSKKRSSKP